MGFVALEFLIGVQIRIGVTQADHETDADLIVFHVVKERTAVSLSIKRPAGSVNDEATLVVCRRYLPWLLQTNTVHLRVAAFIKPIFCGQLPPELAAAS